MQRVEATHVTHLFAKDLPRIAKVDPGETFQVETRSSSRVATGPIFVRGCDAGDVLAIKILDIELPGEAAMWILPGRGVYGEYLADRISGRIVRPIPLVDGHAVFREDIRIPLNPMVGVIGVAPAAMEQLTFWPGRHGGNLDCKEVTTGATLYLPVATQGALLGVGDVHAAMGDGEIMLTGVESTATVTLQVEVLRGKSLRHPFVEDARCIYALASHRSIDRAILMAIEEMIELLCAQLGLKLEEAGMLISAAADVGICQVVNPMVTARVAMPKVVAPTLRV